MNNPLPTAAQRVADAASALGLDIRVLEMPDSTRTAEDAARACGCSVGQIVKSLVFAGKETDTPYLLLVSGDNRVDEKLMAEVLGEPLRLGRTAGSAVAPCKFDASPELSIRRRRHACTRRYDRSRSTWSG